MKRLLEDFMKKGCKCWIKEMKREVLNFQNIKKKKQLLDVGENWPTGKCLPWIKD